MARLLTNKSLKGLYDEVSSDLEYLRKNGYLSGKKGYLPDYKITFDKYGLNYTVANQTFKVTGEWSLNGGFWLWIEESRSGPAGFYLAGQVSKSTSDTVFLSVGGPVLFKLDNTPASRDSMVAELDKWGYSTNTAFCTIGLAFYDMADKIRRSRT